MSIYTVHVQKSDTTAVNARFIREGFTWAALIFGPLWLLIHRLWLALLLYCLALILITALAYYMHLDNGTSVVLSELISLYLALEGNQLRRNTAERRGWTMVDVISAINLEAAERLFFSRWPAQDCGKSPLPQPQSIKYSGTDILGLFPQKGV